MIENWLIEKDKLILYTSCGIVIYADKYGGVHQETILYFLDDIPIWKL